MGHRAGLAMIAAMTSALCAAPCASQVMEIGAGGEVSVYDGPAVYTAEGATPFARSRPRDPASRSRVTADARSAIAHAATAAQLSPALVEAVAWQESRLRHGAVSRAGALGEMQLMPTTAAALGVDPRDSRQNFDGGAAYLGRMMRRYDGDLQRALAAYDAGPAAVERYGGVPPFKETQAYVAAVMERLSRVATTPAPQGAGR